MVPSLLPFLFTLMASAAADCTNCVHHSKAAFFSRDTALPAGACGYGSLALGFYSGHLAAAVPSLFKGGAGCGACFQIRCNNSAVCSKTGTQVILTDFNHSNATDFVVSSRAFRAMASPGMDRKLLGLGLVDVEYKRIPCGFKSRNLTVRVEEFSKYPYYLAIKVLYLGGQTDVFSIEVAQVNPQAGSPSWVSLKRNYGAVWDTDKVPRGSLQLRFAVIGGYDTKFILAKNFLPAEWKTGAVYDTGVQITDVSQLSCSTPCDASHWL